MSSKHPAMQPTEPLGLIGKVLAMPNETPQKMLILTVSLCFVCALIVSGSAVLLKPLQERNKAAERSKNILAVAGLLTSDQDVQAVFRERITPKVVDLATGEYADTIDPLGYDQRAAAKDPAQSIALSAEEDIAKIRRRAKYANVYLVEQDGRLQTVVLPVHGYGLWSTIYGFVALEGDARTIQGLSFYEHAETPGLGGEVSNPVWRAKWQGKLISDDTGKVRIEVVKGQVDQSKPDARYEVDGIAGATLTSRGVSHLMQYWLGANGFGPYLARLRTQEG